MNFYLSVFFTINILNLTFLENEHNIHKADFEKQNKQKLSHIIQTLFFLNLSRVDKISYSKSYNSLMEELQISKSHKDCDPLLESEKIVIIKRESQKSESLQIYEYQVSGKTPKYIDNVNGLIYKRYSTSQYQFYEFLTKIAQIDERFKLKRFIPQYLGVFLQSQLEKMSAIKSQKKQQIKLWDSQSSPQKESKNHKNLWITHISSRQDFSSDKEEKKYICMKNLTFKYQNPNILDLKLGKKNPKKSNIKFQKSTTNTHNFRINGMVTQLHNGEEFQQYFISKYFGQKITVNQIQIYLALFFFNGNSINIDILQKVLNQLKQLIQSFKKFYGVRFISSSLFISFDADFPQSFVVRLIDFDKYEYDQQLIEDTNILSGLKNIYKFLQNIILDIENHERILLDKELQIFKEEVLVVPEQKMEEYKHKKYFQQDPK